jgi:hypothetical protein
MPPIPGLIIGAEPSSLATAVEARRQGGACHRVGWPSTFRPTSSTAERRPRVMVHVGVYLLSIIGALLARGVGCLAGPPVRPGEWPAYGSDPGALRHSPLKRPPPPGPFRPPSSSLASGA